MAKHFLMAALLAAFYVIGFFSCKKNATESVVNLPEVVTANISEITLTAAQCGGTITSDGGAAVTARGVCWSTHPAPVISDNKTSDGTGSGSFTSHITGLTPHGHYFIKAYATNSAGTSYGDARAFTSLVASGTVTDIDGNIYQTLTIDNQEWMVENLKVTRYRNGDPIPNVADNGAWTSLSTGASCNYNNDANNVAVYGCLYNWYTVNDSRQIAPAGWHVATDAEWQTLVDYLGSDSLAGGKMKTIGTIEAGNGLWKQPNIGATNESGFSALPGGYRDDPVGAFHKMSYDAWWWTSSVFSAYTAWARGVDYGSLAVTRTSLASKRYGGNVRCVRD